MLMSMMKKLYLHLMLLCAAFLLINPIMPSFGMTNPTQDLWNAIMAGDLEKAGTALDNGADIDAIGREFANDDDPEIQDMSMLMLAIARKADIASLTFLVEHDADIHYTLPEGEAKGTSALLMADYFGYQEAAQMLKSAGATLSQDELRLKEYLNYLRTRDCTYSDMQMIAGTVEEFRDIYGFYPKVSKNVNFFDVLKDMKAFGELKGNLFNYEAWGRAEDCWWRPLQYQSDGTAYTLMSYGADAKKGENSEFGADIVLTQHKEPSSEALVLSEAIAAGETDTVESENIVEESKQNLQQTPVNPQAEEQVAAVEKPKASFKIEQLAVTIYEEVFLTEVTGVIHALRQEGTQFLALDLVILPQWTEEISSLPIKADEIALITSDDAAIPAIGRFEYAGQFKFSTDDLNLYRRSDWQEAQQKVLYNVVFAIPEESRDFQFQIGPVLASIEKPENISQSRDHGSTIKVEVVSHRLLEHAKDMQKVGEQTFETTLSNPHGKLLELRLRTTAVIGNYKPDQFSWNTPWFWVLCDNGCYTQAVAELFLEEKFLRSANHGSSCNSDGENWGVNEAILYFPVPKNTKSFTLIYVTSTIGEFILE